MDQAPVHALPRDDVPAPVSRREKQHLLTAAIRSLLALQELTSADVRLVARSVGVDESTVWRRLKRARATGTADLPPREHFEITEELRVRLAYHRGNVRGVHDELVTEAGHTEDDSDTEAGARKTACRVCPRCAVPSTGT